MSGYIDWSPQIYCEATRSGRNYFRSDLKSVKIANNVLKVRAINEKCKNVNVTLIANHQCRPIDWSPEIYSESLPSGHIYFRHFTAHPSATMPNDVTFNSVYQTDVSCDVRIQA